MDNRWIRFVVTDWSRRATALLTFVFMLQFVSWFGAEEAMWWPETVTMVKLTLYGCLILELLPWFRLVPVRLGQLAFVLIANVIYSGYKPVLYKVHNWKDMGDWLYDNFWQMHPYIWFSLGAWCAFALGTAWMTSRWRIGTATLTAVLIMAVRDSFSTVFLWRETAMVILCGLLLLSVHHFGSLKRRNPEGWAYLAEYPGTLLATIAILIAVTFLPGILMPNIRPMVNDPYTAYLLWKGEEAPAFGKSVLGDTGLIPSSGSSESGYSRDDSSLGGGFDWDYSPVMRVETNQVAYWRGETRSLYTTSGWEMSEGDKKAETVVVGAEAELPKDPRFDTSQLKTVTVKQTVTMLRKEDSFPVLFGAFAAGKVESVNGEKSLPDRIRWSPRQSEIRFNEGGKKAYPEKYVVESQVPVLDEAGLNRATGPINRAQFAEYLQLPRDLPARVRQLAQDVTAGGNTPYQKAKQIEAYLQKTYPYTSKPKTELGQSKDFVDRFLFEIKEGYCDYYSSAMAVMSRAVGIPSRWVKGYSSGHNELEDRAFGQIPMDYLKDPAGAGTYMVRNSDAHSWVELYFPGYGWIPFEPTSGFVLPKAESKEDPVLELDTGDALPDGAATEEEEKAGFPWTPVIGAGGGIVVLALLWLFRKRLPKPKAFVRLPLRKPSDPNQRVIHSYNKLMYRYRRKGFPVYEHETARETVKRLKARDLWMSDDLEHLLQLFERAKYSPSGITAEESGRAHEIAEKLKKAI